MRQAVYPGSFDPVSNGHLDIIRRAAKIFARLYVLVSVNPNKQYLFTAEERVDMLKAATADIANVVIEASEELVVSYAQKKGNASIIRGVRNTNDYQAEITLYQFNHTIDPEIETLVMFPSHNNLFVTSSAIKELALFGNDISPYVPKEISEFILHTIKHRLKKS
ncbi:MAG TPA: pantetheine-phosphate adenylyltransferase [Bacilli bacterium]|nr:pantetheine-phosphate adenylyltransferase [Bacilli bacterium]HOR20315.1 pantetheine-phosphate adenylyltransferase [Bacilli bacterium]HPK67628.1 pantetheine-phosphate adenylyltransferase [Bacilli bacterium]